MNETYAFNEVALRDKLQRLGLILAIDTRDARRFPILSSSTADLLGVLVHTTVGFTFYPTDGGYIPVSTHAGEEVLLAKLEQLEKDRATATGALR